MDRMNSPQATEARQSIGRKPWRGALAVGLAMLLCSGTTWADEASKAQKLKHLAELQGLTEMIQKQRETMQTRTKAITDKMLDDALKQVPEMDATAKGGLQAAAKKFMEAMVTAQPSVEETVDAWTRFYGEQVSEDDVEKILAFTESPAGKKSIEASKLASPKMAAFHSERLEQVGQKAMQTYMQEVRGVIEQVKHGGK